MNAGQEAAVRGAYTRLTEFGASPEKAVSIIAVNSPFSIREVRRVVGLTKARAPRKPQHAGLRRWYPNVLTGGHVGLYDGVPGGYDTSGGRWQAVCEDHGAICSNETFELARASARCPEEWCEDCMALDSCKSSVVE